MMMQENEVQYEDCNITTLLVTIKDLNYKSITSLHQGIIALTLINSVKATIDMVPMMLLERKNLPSH